MMIIRRIELTHYRGVTNQKVDLDDGITVIEGPNEVGKTSLAEALRLLFEFKDTSKHHDVKSTFPVDRDEGPCIEAEIETGPYRFVYRKRFKKKPETQLTVLAPTPESLTGEEAHERAIAIMAETLDVDLWRALQVEQGVALDQAVLSDSKALSVALDAASGSAGSGAEYGPIYDRATSEYLRYFTGTGKETKDLKTCSVIADELRQRLDEVVVRLAELGKDTERSARLSELIHQLEEGLPNLEAEATEARTNWEMVSKLVEQARTARAEADTAGLRAKQTRDEVAAREKLKKDLATTESELSELESSSKDDVDAWENAGIEHKKTEAEVTERKEALGVATTRQEQCHADRDYRQDESEVERFNDRLKFISEAEETKRRALEIVESTKITEDTYKILQDLDRAVEVAKGQLAAGGPTVHLTACVDLEVEVGGESTQIDKDSGLELSIERTTTIRVPDILEATVEPGSSTYDLSQTVERTREQLKETLRKNGIESVGAAFEVLREVGSAKGNITQADEQIKQHLRDLSRDEIIAKSTALEKRVTEYEDARDSAMSLPPSIETAEEAYSRAAEGYTEALDKYEGACTVEFRARERLESFRGSTDQTRLALDTKRNELERLNKENGDAEKGTAFDILEKDCIAQENLASEAQDAARGIDADLQIQDPDRIEALLNSAEAALDNGRKSLQGNITERSGVEGRLDANREQGLAEEHGHLEANLSSAIMEQDRYQASAEAARLLFETLNRHRDQARRAYVAPLKSLIDKLGKVVFSVDFEVTLSDELTVESRTMHGITVPYSGLSGGAKEQVGLLVRIAAAMMVSDDSGVPLILDDTLGYSDPDRIKTMCAMLSQAGRECQIIILTCTPERFRWIGGAKFLRIADEPEAM